METDSVQDELVHCIYSSAETVAFSRKDIFSLLEIARKTNQALNISGILLYDRGTFFQILEGHREAVRKLYEKIEKDKRHTRVTKIILEPIENRDFSQWTMGYSGVTRQILGTMAGLNDFFHSGRCYTELDEGRAKKLLDAFKEGRWRATIS